MSSLSQRLHLGVQQKQILTPGLVQMVTVLQLNRMELKDMIINEIAENPVLEEAADGGEELTPAEVQSILECERESDPADRAILDKVDQPETLSTLEAAADGEFALDHPITEAPEVLNVAPSVAEEPAKTETDPFEEID